MLKNWDWHGDEAILYIGKPFNFKVYCGTWTTRNPDDLYHTKSSRLYQGVSQSVLSCWTFFGSVCWSLEKKKKIIYQIDHISRYLDVHVVICNDKYFSCWVHEFRNADLIKFEAYLSCWMYEIWFRIKITDMLELDISCTCYMTCGFVVFCHVCTMKALHLTGGF